MLSDLRDNGEPEEPVIQVVIGEETYAYGPSKLALLSELLGSNTKEGAKITLLADVTLEDGIQVAAYGAFDENDQYVVTPKTVEIDLNDNTLNGFVQFNSGVTGTVKNGTINNSSNYPAIDVTGTATVEDMTVKSTATKAFRVADGAALTVKAGTYSSDPTAYLPEGYKAVAEGENWVVKPVVTVTFGDATMVDGNELPEFTWTSNFTDVSEDGEMLVVNNPEITVNGAGEYEITAEAYVFMSDKYFVSVIPGKLTVKEAFVEMDGVYYVTIKDALGTLRSADTTVHTVKVLKDLDIDVNYSTYNYPILVNGLPSSWI